MAENEQSRRDVLAAALDTAMTPPAESEATSQPAAEPTSAGPSEASDVPRETSAAEKVDRNRHPDGKFAREPKKPKAPEAQPAAASVTTAPAKPPRKYPSSWKPDYQPIWQELDADEKRRGILDEVERREQDYFKSIEQYKADGGFGASIRKVIAPFEATLRSMGARPEQAIAGLLASDHALRYGNPAQKAQAVQRLFQSYGLDPGMLQQERSQVDPNVAALQQQLAAVQQQSQQIQQSFRQQMSAQAQAEIAAFKKDRPYFEEVKGKMGQLIQAGVVSTLQDAYDTAVHADPAIRERVLAEQRDKAEREKQAKAQQAAQAAKAAAVQVRGAPSGNSQSVPGKTKDRRSAIAQALEDAA